MYITNVTYPTPRGFKISFSDGRYVQVGTVLDDTLDEVKRLEHELVWAPVTRFDILPCGGFYLEYAVGNELAYIKVQGSVDLTKEFYQFLRNTGRI